MMRMFQIEIHIPRPLLTLSLIGGGVAFVMWNGGVSFQSVGGTGTVKAEIIQTAEEEIRNVRLEQDVLARREDILRAQMEALEEEQRVNYDPAIEAEFNETRLRLIALIQNQKQAEQEILLSLRQIWEAQGYALNASRTDHGTTTIDLIWPADPELGISAHFEDGAYEARFGMPHHAIDIPVNQGSVVASAADGTVMKVSDNGMGFNSLVIRHKGGFATLYGHVSSFLVEEGDKVSAGDPIALSGGRPGTAGAGNMTTGPHLHFQLIKDGSPVDPLKYLPAL
jgi:murein DD-endopeptidase MepM/ murein hydrolase activator NlpD